MCRYSCLAQLGSDADASVCCCQETDSGLYTCLASSSSGESSWSSALTVRGKHAVNVVPVGHDNLSLHADMHSLQI